MTKISGNIAGTDFDGVVQPNRARSRPMRGGTTVYGDDGGRYTIAEASQNISAGDTTVSLNPGGVAAPGGGTATAPGVDVAAGQYAFFRNLPQSVGIVDLALEVGRWTPRGVIYGQQIGNLRITAGDPNGHWEATSSGIQRAASFTGQFDPSYALTVDTGANSAEATWTVTTTADTGDVRNRADVAAATALINNTAVVKCRPLEPIDFITDVFGLLGQSQAVNRATVTASVASPDPEFWVGRAALQWGVSDFPGELLFANSALQDGGPRFAGGTGLTHGIGTALYAANPNACPLIVNGAVGGTAFTDGQWGEDQTLEDNFTAAINAAVAATNASVVPKLVMQHGAAPANITLSNNGVFDVAVDEHIRRVREGIVGGFEAPVVMVGLTAPREIIAPLVQAANELLPSRTEGTAFIDISDAVAYPRQDDSHLDRAGMLQAGQDIFNVAFPAAVANVTREPTAAQNLTVTATQTVLSATWDASAFDGHPELALLYRVEMRPQGGGYAIVQDSEERSFATMMVVQGVTYDIRVTPHHGQFEGPSVEASATIVTPSADIEEGLTLTQSVPVGSEFDITFDRTGTMLAVFDASGIVWDPPDMIWESGGTASGTFVGLEDGTGDFIAISGSRDTGQFAEARIPAASRPTTGTIGVYFEAGTPTTPARATIYIDNEITGTSTPHPLNNTDWTGGNAGAHLLLGGGGGAIGGQNTGSIPPGGTFSALRLYENQPPNSLGGGSAFTEPTYAMDMPALDLVPYANATHFAETSGNWSTPGTWNTGTVPGAGARVVILPGVDVTFDDNTGTRLDWVRVVGTLTVVRGADTLLFAETIITDPNSLFDWGTEASPVTADATIRFADNGDIDPATDPMLLSRGLMNMGPLTMYGVEKTAWRKLAGYPAIGDTQITLDAAPTNWNVGDQLVIAGTQYDGYDAQRVFQGHEDEERTITAINGATITLDSALAFNHDHGQPDGNRGIVANYTRNIVMETENGATALTHRKGHAMFMHPNSRLTAVAANFMGRTDKSFRSFNDPADAGTITATTNLQGRYPFHWHINGTDVLGWAHNCAVWTSPGIGMVHHASWVDIEDCCTYATYGAGMFAEEGNEVGHWDRNAIIFAQGREWASSKVLRNYTAPGVRDTSAAAYFFFDHGAAGVGMCFRGRAVKVRDNVVASVNECYSWLLRGTSINNITTTETDTLEGFMEDALDRTGRTFHDRVPIHFFKGNEGFASRALIFVEKNDAQARQPLSTRFEDSIGWNVRKGADLAYVGIYILDNLRLYGRGGSIAIEFEQNVYGMVMTRNYIQDFDTGMTWSGFSSAQLPLTQPEWNMFEADNTFVNVNTETVNIERVTPAPATPFNVTLDTLTYDPDPNRRSVTVTGSQTDSLGVVPVPLRNVSGVREYEFDFAEVISIVRDQQGYWVEGGTNREWSVAYLVFTDRWTRLDYYVPVFFSADPGGFSTVNFFDGATANAGGLSAMYAQFPNVSTVVPRRFEDADWHLVPGDTQITVDIITSPAEPITDIEYRLDFGPWTSSGGTGDFTLTGLTNGERSRVEIRPINGPARGEGAEAKRATPTV